MVGIRCASTSGNPEAGLNAKRIKCTDEMFSKLFFRYVYKIYNFRLSVKNFQDFEKMKEKENIRPSCEWMCQTC